MKGFSLIELMIAVAIIGIIATIAVPQYSDYITKTRRTDATAALLNMAAQQEKYYLQNNTYATNDNIADVGGTIYGNNGYYTLEITAAGATSFTLTATATGAQAGDSDCATINYSSNGGKTPAACW